MAHNPNTVATLDTMPKIMQYAGIINAPAEFEQPLCKSFLDAMGMLPTTPWRVYSRTSYEDWKAGIDAWRIPVPITGPASVDQQPVYVPPRP